MGKHGPKPSQSNREKECEAQTAGYLFLDKFVWSSLATLHSRDPKWLYNCLGNLLSTKAGSMQKASLRLFQEELNPWEFKVSDATC